MVATTEGTAGEVTNAGEDFVFGAPAEGDLRDRAGKRERRRRAGSGRTAPDL